MTRRVHGTVDAVRRYLLADATETLDTLTTMTEAEARANTLANDERSGLRLVELQRVEDRAWPERRRT